MKYVWLIAAALLLVSGTFAGQPVKEGEPGKATCPARRAAELGHDPFEEFHKIMAPVWHTAWAEKNYDALLAAGPKFKESFAEIAEMEPTFKTETRKKAFVSARKNFANLVSQYAEAAARGDKETVYKLMPELHDAFEMSASTLLPISYPEIEAVAIALKLIEETHLPKSNTEGIVGSTETLVAKFDGLTDTTTIPEELKDRQSEILTEIAVMKKLAAQMKECCDKNDMDAYKQHLAELNEKLDGFFKKYI